jgi:hypothetical protein
MLGFARHRPPWLAPAYAFAFASLGACGGRATLDGGPGSDEWARAAAPLCAPACESAAAACELAASADECTSQCARRTTSCLEHARSDGVERHDSLLRCVIEHTSNGACDLGFSSSHGACPPEAEQYLGCVFPLVSHPRCEDPHPPPGQPCICDASYKSETAEIPLSVVCTPFDATSDESLCDCTLDEAWLGRCVSNQRCYSGWHCCDVLAVLHGLP